MTKSNLSLVLKSMGDLRLENRPVPVPAPHEVLIGVNSVGICGSDIHYWKNGRIGDFIVKEPMVLGHETSGTVIEVGSAVTNFKKGDRVCLEPGIPCRTCEICKKGRYNLCPDVKFCATPPEDGSLCQYYCHPADFCFKLPDNVSFEEGALIEPLSVAVHACKRAGVTAGSCVLICGAGPIGLITLLTAKAMGASKIYVTDISDFRLAIAKQLGAQVINVQHKNIEETVEEIKSAGSPDMTIECSGAQFSVYVGVKATKSGGVLAVVGLGLPEISFPIVEAIVREIDVRGVFRYANCYKAALGLVTSGAVNLNLLITNRFPFRLFLSAFQTAHTGAGGAIKVIIKCEDLS